MPTACSQCMSWNGRFGHGARTLRKMRPLTSAAAPQAASPRTLSSEPCPHQALLDGADVEAARPAWGCHPARSRSCAGTWTGCRSRWSWRRRASGSCRCRRSRAGWTTGSRGGLMCTLDCMTPAVLEWAAADNRPGRPVERRARTPANGFGPCSQARCSLVDNPPGRTLQGVIAHTNPPADQPSSISPCTLASGETANPPPARSCGSWARPVPRPTLGPA